MARQQGAGVKAWGISNTLRSNGCARSERLDPTDRKNQRTGPGFKVTTVSETIVRLEYSLGTNHRIVDAGDREATVSSNLDKYAALLQANFITERSGTGEKAHLLVRERPNPLIAQTLRRAAAILKSAKNSGAAEKLELWASLSDEGLDW
jgi:hypothetical protein